MERHWAIGIIDQLQNPCPTLHYLQATWKQPTAQCAKETLRCQSRYLCLIVSKNKMSDRNVNVT